MLLSLLSCLDGQNTKTIFCSRDTNLVEIRFVSLNKDWRCVKKTWNQFSCANKLRYDSLVCGSLLWRLLQSLSFRIFRPLLLYRNTVFFPQMAKQIFYTTSMHLALRRPVVRPCVETWPPNWVGPEHVTVLHGPVAICKLGSDLLLNKRPSLVPTLAFWPN